MAKDREQAPEDPRRGLRQVNVRLPAVTLRQIADLRAALGLPSDARVVIMAVDRMAQAEENREGNDT